MRFCDYKNTLPPTKQLQGIKNMQAMVLSIIGADKLGLVDEVASAIAKAEGNWLRSSFCHLSGHFLSCKYYATDL
jgi:formyltetrahydrofolate hydrolase